MSDAMLLISAIIIAMICFLLGMVYEQKMTIDDLQKMLRDENNVEENEKENEKENSKENNEKKYFNQHNN